MTDATSNDIDDVEAPAPVLFDAVLHPHTSLGPRGFLVVMVLMSSLALTLGIAFFAAGAWPIVGFLGLDVLLVFVALKISYRRARMFETVRLTSDALTVERVVPNKPTKRWTFQPYWLRVSIDDPPRHESQIMLSSHGHYLIIGSFLTPEERLDFANALRRALRLARETPQTAL